MANHGHHIPIGDDIRLIADSAVAGNDISSALLLLFSGCELDDVIQGQGTFERPAVFLINYRIRHR